MNLNFKTSAEECLLVKDVENGTIEECYYGEHYQCTVPKSIQDAMSALDAALWAAAIQTKLNSVFQSNTLSGPMIYLKGNELQN